ncbi:MAG: RnfABCDGE type electron transport complex subunit D, partial [Lentisphaerae bacterium]|nr:RnfABCDGE type electron transport complex subunit D [Lentisphaerota bacterium]
MPSRYVAREERDMPANRKLVKWQLPMRRVLVALVPVACASIYFFGWRALVMLVTANVVGFLTEYAFTRGRNEPVSSAVFVTATLLALSLPPGLPHWMVVVGVVFAVTFGKMVFGGFGKNVFNPALTGRAFLYVSFGAHMTAQWHEPVAGPFGGLKAYAADAVTGATPGMALKTGTEMDFLPLVLGNTAGVMGGTCAVLVLAGGIYILWKKAANYRIVVSGLLGFLGMQTLLWLTEPGQAADPIRALFAG